MMVDFDREDPNKAHKGWQLLVLAGVFVGVVLRFMEVI